MALQKTELADAIEAAMKVEWRAVNGSELPDAGLPDRRMLFAAIARGLLTYLDDKQDELIETITFEPHTDSAATRTVTNLKLDLAPTR